MPARRKKAVATKRTPPTPPTPPTEPAPPSPPPITLTIHNAPRHVKGLMECGPFMLKILASSLGILPDEDEKIAFMRDPMESRAHAVLNGLRVYDKHHVSVDTLIERFERDIQERRAAIALLQKAKHIVT